MTEPELLAFVLRVLRLIDPMDCDEIQWRTDGEYAPVSFFVNCSDLFWWGTSDFEDVTPENIGELERAYADVRAIVNPVNNEPQELFACRMRHLRPQGAAYPKDERLWPLFDACGAERETGMGNPHSHPSKKMP